MCEDSNETVLGNLIDAMWDNDGERIGLCVSSISLNSDTKDYILKKVQSLDEKLANDILKLLN